MKPITENIIKESAIETIQSQGWVFFTKFNTQKISSIAQLGDIMLQKAMIGVVRIIFKNKLFDKAIREHGFVERTDADELLWKKLPEWMDDKQKKNKITNLLSELRRKEIIHNTESDTKSRWTLKENLYEIYKRQCA